MRRLMALVFLAFATACASTPGMKNLQIQTDSNSMYEFSKLKRFAFAPETGITFAGDVEKTEFVNARIQRAIIDELAAKGYEQSGAPDFWITYDAHVKNKEKSVKKINFDVEAYVNDEHVRHVTLPYQEGTLILMALDAKTAKTIWRGSAQAQLEKAVTAEQRNERIRAAVGGMLASLPSR